MKTRSLIFGVMLLSLAAFGQGKVVFGNNSERLFVMSGWAGDPSGPIPASPLPSGRTLQALLYAGTTGTSLSLQTAIPLTGANWLEPGRMANFNIVLNGIPGGAPAYFRVLWADTGGTLPGTINGTVSSWEYFQNFTYLASSQLFTAIPSTSIAFNMLVNTGSPANSTWQPGNIGNPIPEPSILALAGLGLSVLRFRRRRQ